MPVFERILQYLHKIRTGKPIRLDWYMSSETRNTIINASTSFGATYLELGETDDIGVLNYYSLFTGNPLRDKFDIAVTKLIEKIIICSEIDERQNDIYFIPAILTRLDSYMKVDGISKEDRKYVVSHLRKKLNLTP